MLAQGQTSHPVDLFRHSSGHQSIL